ncbi:dehydrogenase/reductase SDR family member 12-like isoform X2 [Haemaphysalis longicornis]
MTSLYRNVFWFAKGMKEYSRSGFRSACRSFNLPDLDVDCTGKVFMITGATGTLGKVIAIQLAQKGGTVHLVCRNEEKAEALRKTIVDITENESSVVVHIVDMSHPQTVFNFAKKFKQNHGILHVLVNCASTVTQDREIGEDGLERTFATNTLGVHILITNLIPLLNQSCEPRVVLVTCGSLLTQRLEPVDLQFECMFPFNGLAAFTQTKRHQAVLVEHYAEAHPGIHFSAVHPGWLEAQAHSVWCVQGSRRLPQGYCGGSLCGVARLKKQQTPFCGWPSREQLSDTRVACSFKTGEQRAPTCPLARQRRAWTTRSSSCGTLRTLCRGWGSPSSPCTLYSATLWPRSSSVSA